MPTLLAFAGSTRTDSFNKKLVRIAVAGARAAGAEVDLIDLRDFPMPLYDGDLEKGGMPEPARAFKKLLVEHPGFLISSPEYNSSFSGVLKNAIDWASRSENDREPPLVAFKGKAAMLMSASPGGLGGLRGLASLRPVLSNIGMMVLPDQVAVSRAGEAFDADGRLKDARQQAAVEKLGATLWQFVLKNS